MTNHYKIMETNDVTGVKNMLSATDNNEHHDCTHGLAQW